MCFFSPSCSRRAGLRARPPLPHLHGKRIRQSGRRRRPPPRLSPPVRGSFLGAVGLFGQRRLNCSHQSAYTYSSEVVTKHGRKGPPDLTLPPPLLSLFFPLTKKSRGKKGNLREYFAYDTNIGSSGCVRPPRVDFYRFLTIREK